MLGAVGIPIGAGLWVVIPWVTKLPKFLPTMQCPGGASVWVNIPLASISWRSRGLLTCGSMAAIELKLELAIECGRTQVIGMNWNTIPPSLCAEQFPEGEISDTTQKVE